MSDSTLMATIQRKVVESVQQKLGRPIDAELSEVIGASIKEAITEYRASAANSSSYETALGAFIIEQNPYASWENLDLPDLPLKPNGENPWVRRSGVLADYNALNPLPEELPIPAGIVVNFSYVDWPELRDYNQNDHPAEQPPSPEAFIKPDAEVELTTSPVPFKSRFYPHNVVKAVRLRYTVLDRRYKMSSDDAGRAGRDKQIGYILILYSGGDSH